ncbi:cyclic AMP-dependent transcription factor ATF-2 isoform X2 [Nylanderia fulva]|uniref:cyclic AMP-dependent transcription factor ATF-2 isoform X2 n=1 Tax=Nylanderia fulva TaxID=613905 RepID=UPI0010FB3789|nr:cyclic AMP-dependent transcription factor ATF-2 isoform X2 [Nylanderia fulva]
MTDAEKLFACSTSGCNMSFTNEDQLTLHKKKHDMMLNLGNNSKSAGFVDQTPTPTRFFKNCEEVGLFQDLQVNPFEETFRRAVEAGNTGTLTVPEAGIVDDTLHTPHIFPYISDVLPASQILSESNVEDCPSTVSLSEKSTEEAIKSNECRSIKISTNETQELTKDANITSTKNNILAPSIIVSDTNTPIAPKLSPTQLSSHLSINGEEVQLLLKTADGKLMQLSAMPVSESSNVANVNNVKQQTVVIKTEPALRCVVKSESKKTVISRLSLAKMKLKQTLSKNSQNQKAVEESAKMNDMSKKENVKKTVDQLKKKDILERNRASSMRARAKRKAWIQDLQRTVTNVNEANAALQMEVKALRSEVAKLKTLLLAHKDCPVTKAMQKGSGIFLGPKIISINNPDVLTMPISANSIPVKRSYPETPNTPVKKSTVSVTKNPIIFPKVDCGAANITLPNTTIIKSLPTLKIVGVNQFLPEATKPEETKQILIVQNQSRKLCEARQVIQINPNYEVEHAASKSTGT